MLIKVFGEWINPDHVVGLSQEKDKDGTNYILINFINNGTNRINHKTECEVAEEINKQIKENRDE